AGPGGGRHVRAVAGLERVRPPVRAALLHAQHDRRRRDRAVLQHRRGAVELHDGRGADLLPAADRHLLRAPPLHRGGPDARGHQGLSNASLLRRARWAEEPWAQIMLGSRSATTTRNRKGDFGPPATTSFSPTKSGTVAT